MSEKTLIVDDTRELYNALDIARGGDTIELADGDYGAVNIGARYARAAEFDSGVTITSSQGMGATISELNLRGDVSNLEFENIHFDYEFSDADHIWNRQFRLQNVDNVAIRDSEFSGDVATGVSDAADGFAFGKGLNIAGSSDLEISGNEIHGFWKGLGISDSSDVVVEGNDVHDMRSDGVSIGGVSGLTFEDNYIHDFATSKNSRDHADFLQLINRNADTPTNNAVFRGNTFDVGTGGVAQIFFGRNIPAEGNEQDTDAFYKAFTIEDNVIYGSHTHGISLGAVQGLDIQNNALLRIDAGTGDGGVTVPGINIAEAALDVDIHDNVAAEVPGTPGDATWSVDGTAIVSDGAGGGEANYQETFLTSTMDFEASGHAFKIQPGSRLDVSGAAPERLFLKEAPQEVRPYFDAALRDDGSGDIVLDASYTTGPTDGVEYSWHFGDGSTAEGMRVAHDFSETGIYEVALDVVRNGETVASENGLVQNNEGDLLSLDPETGDFRLSTPQGEVGVGNDAAREVGTQSGVSLRIGEDGAYESVAHGALDRLYGADNFTIDATFETDLGAAGEIFRIHTNMDAAIRGDGDLSFTMAHPDGSTSELTTDGLSLNDGAAHDIRIALDPEAGTLSLRADGGTAAEIATVGAVDGDDGYDLQFGDRYHPAVAADLSAFNIEVAGSIYPDYTGPREILDADSSDSGGQAESKAGARMRIDDFVLDPGDAYLENGAAADPDGSIRLEGGNEAANLAAVSGLDAFADSSAITIETTFARANAGSGDGSLFWKHKDFAVILDGAGLEVRANGADHPFYDTLSTGDIGLDDTESHTVRLSLDQEADMVRLNVDGETVIESDSRDLDFAGGQAWNWQLGTGWGGSFDGRIDRFAVEDGTLSDERDGDTPPAELGLDPLDGYRLAPGAVESEGGPDLANGAALTEDGIRLHGGSDSVGLGALDQFNDASALSIQTTFSRAEADTGDGNVFWKHKAFALILDDNGLEVRLPRDGHAFYDTLSTGDIGLDDTESHTARLSLDRESDEFQLVVDDRVAINESDLDLADPADTWDWQLGTGWGGSFNGEIEDFAIDTGADMATRSEMDHDGSLLIA